MDFFGRKFRMFRNESKRVEGFIRVSRVKYALNTKEKCARYSCNTDLEHFNPGNR